MKNIPDDIYERLKLTAAAHHRSVNMEAIACLQQVLLPGRASVQEHLLAARKLRAALQPGKFKPADIERAIREGRP